MLVQDVPNDVPAAHEQLLAWCREHDFAGHDPFDALNSRLFQATPFAGSRNARLLWTQLVKRSPADLRPLARVPPERNAKGIALFALAQLAAYRRLRTAEAEQQTRNLLSMLLSMKVDGCSGAAWGYNFDWQSRNFFAPRGTPTIVPTAFAARAFIEAARVFKDDEYLRTACSVCDFILTDLPRTVETDTEICFSYAPHTNTRIFNASLLAAEVLAEVGELTNRSAMCFDAERAARYVVNQQQPDGSWTYGTDPNQSWIDNFHTAYILFSLKRITAACSRSGAEFQQALERGFRYWKETFFLADGWPKYYHDDPYPVDAHAAASAIVTLLECRELDETSATLAHQIASWTIANLRDKQGFFYYQRRRFYTVRKPYMRWTQAWMLYALARLLEGHA
ncbi:MAG TPA: prenyltransferase/squalene oxidase repeat-containing protein [Pyrinomonadaceae bacterium]|nr:prenyltransferase/squalene oxidase repeat-containing protein [Pyrinomonadaceae bacterium]